MNPVFFADRLPPLKKVFQSIGYKKGKALLICDKRFRSQPLLKPWEKNKNIFFYYVSSGEKTKSLERLPLHIRKIQTLNQDFDKKSSIFMSLGGGSLTDLTGFLASIYKRGLPLIHFPTTWLAALDSAHGGKTAVNFQNIKNLLGSYHFPKAVFIVKSFLDQNPADLKRSAKGELLKMALIEGGFLYNKLTTEYPNLSMERFLKPAIQAKRKIISKDPYEARSLRKKLNLGHTVGHILENLYPLPHGLAVFQGLLFSLNWSLEKGFMNTKNYEEVKLLLPKQKKHKKISVSVFRNLLKQDKKHKRDGKIDFVFIKKPGMVFTQPVSEEDLLYEAQRQGLINRL